MVAAVLTAVGHAPGTGRSGRQVACVRLGRGGRWAGVCPASAGPCFPCEFFRMRERTVYPDMSGLLCSRKGTSHHLGPPFPLTEKETEDQREGTDGDRGLNPGSASAQRDPTAVAPPWPPRSAVTACGARREEAGLRRFPGAEEEEVGRVCFRRPASLCARPPCPGGEAQACSCRRLWREGGSPTCVQKPCVGPER